MEAASLGGGERTTLQRSPLARFPDRALRWFLTALATSILALIVYFFVKLVGEARPAFAKFGVIGFTFDNNWNVSANEFGALPLLVGTLITSGLALIIGVLWYEPSSTAPALDFSSAIRSSAVSGAVRSASNLKSIM